MGFKYIPLSDEDKIIFCGEALRKKYWEQFYDVCNTLLWRWSNQKESYLPKYESFFENYKDEEKVNIDSYQSEMLTIKEDILEQFLKTVEIIKNPCLIDNATFPMLLTIYQMQKSIEKGLKEDRILMNFINPREININYKKYIIDSDKIDITGNINIKEIKGIDKKILDYFLKEKANCKNWEECLNEVKSGSVNIPLGRIICEWGYSNGDIATTFACLIIEDYNIELNRFCSKIEDDKKNNQNVNAFIFRLFVYTQSSRHKLQQFIDETPVSKHLPKLQELRDKEIKSFKESVLGKHWCDCIKDDNVEAFSSYMVNHRDTISEEEEIGFFRQFNKICMIDDVLRGNADKYYLEVDYSKIYNNSSCIADAEEKKQEIEDDTESVNENKNSDAADENNPLDRIFHEAINMQIMKEAISDIIKHKKDVDKRELSIWQWYVVYRVLKEIDWLTDDTQTKFIQWVKDEFGWSWNTVDFKSINANLKKIRTRDWGKYTVKDNNTGQKYRELADYVRNTFVEIKNDKIYDREKFLRKGSDNTPMFIYHIENQ